MKDIFFKRKQYKFSEWDSNLLPEAHKTRTLPNRLKKHDNVVSKTNLKTNKGLYLTILFHSFAIETISIEM